ncbi:MAG: VanZ family protein [Erysipelotrichaceae bacterium]|nr:VanZ family protein [Erysipelotrichaceae bacterium]
MFTSLKMNILVTVLTIVMIFVLPWFDRFVCRKLGLSLSDGVSTNPNADRLLHIRKILLIVMFCIYLGAVSYVTFFSRDAADDYLLPISLFQDLGNSIMIDSGFFGFLKAIFTDGFSRALSHVSITHPESISQVYMNICLFIPMGYLLPYVFDWFRRNVYKRVIPVCFLASLFIENVQLITKHGFYDCDDLVTNTLGGIIGRLFYIGVAYVLAHPDWRKDFSEYRKWKMNAKTRALYPFMRKIHVVRTTLLGTDSNNIFDFYVTKLGFRLKKTVQNEKTGDISYLLEFGKTQIEIRCIKSLSLIPLQTVTIACNNSERLKDRLKKHGIPTGGYKADPYTGLRTFNFYGPDGVCITIIEE